MRGLRTAWLILLLCVFAVGVPGAAVAAPDDAEVAFCLAAAQRAALQETAQVLELRPEADLAGWRKNKAADFNRACEALYGAQKTPQPDWFTVALPFLTGAVGAMLAFAAAAWWDRVNRGRVLADALRLAVKEFHEEASSYLHDWRPARPDAEFVAKRSRLEHQLAVVGAERRRWKKPDLLIAQLTTGRFGRDMAAGWDDNTEQTRAERKGCVAALPELRKDLLAVSAVLTSPLQKWWRAR
ncbi:hypothetical protein [Lentzea sp. CA-135723]|uniref:hypothetical protein n=1 Tax=Lentzea sp. CA-135723 TaxID=3239950 RepID=UPI003D8D4EAC